MKLDPSGSRRFDMRWSDWRDIAQDVILSAFKSTQLQNSEIRALVLGYICESGRPSARNIALVNCSPTKSTTSQSGFFHGWMLSISGLAEIICTKNMPLVPPRRAHTPEAKSRWR